METLENNDIIWCDCCGSDSNSNDYGCEKCDNLVLVCNLCNAILEPCSCGHCKKGETFVESSD